MQTPSLQCAAWSGGAMRADIECLKGGMTAVESLEKSEVVMEFLQLEKESEVFVAGKVSLLGTNYKPNLFLPTVVENDTPQFSKISSTLVGGQTSDDVYFILEKYENKGFVAHFHSEFTVVPPGQLLDHLPLCGDKNIRTQIRQYTYPHTPHYSLRDWS
jgi:hypothetical protein